MFPRIPFNRVNWTTSSFLIGTLFLSLTAVPLYIWHFGLDWFQAAFFFVMFLCTGLSITLGYHRLFSHLSFKAHWAVRLFTLVFGAAAFENSALMWASDHRKHHKNVDHDDDPYDINKGFFYAHMGWLLFKLDPELPYDNVPDLYQDKLVALQDKYIYILGVIVAFVIPTAIGWAWGGAHAALGAFLIAGVLRVVVLQHCTFFINSACHTIGNRPYSSRCSARDSWIMALFTFGEGYHNYHHEFQHDYRNGVKPWQFDPTKWTIWILSKLRLVGSLRRVPLERIILAELHETQRNIDAQLAATSDHQAEHGILATLSELLQARAAEWEQYRAEKVEITREMLASLREDLRTTILQWKALNLSLEYVPNYVKMKP
jgi:stearoyl-CoA desaturase (delta-9 desaturase)